MCTKISLHIFFLYISNTKHKKYCMPEFGGFPFIAIVGNYKQNKRKITTFNLDYTGIGKSDNSFSSFNFCGIFGSGRSRLFLLLMIRTSRRLISRAQALTGGEVEPLKHSNFCFSRFFLILDLWISIFEYLDLSFWISGSPSDCGFSSYPLLFFFFRFERE